MRLVGQQLTEFPSKLRKYKPLPSSVCKRKELNSLLLCVSPYNDKRINYSSGMFGVEGLLAPPGSGALLSAE